ncbi:MAG: EAL domain-containing protein [Chloroflexota bacterium]
MLPKRVDRGRLELSLLPRWIEHAADHWLMRCFDTALAAAIVGGFVFDPLVVSHLTAILLVVQAFLLDRRAAAIRVVVAASATVTAGWLHAVPPQDLAVQIPFVYGLAILVVLLAETLRRSHGTAVGALKEAERSALYDALTALPNRTLLSDRVEHAIASERRVAGSVAGSVALLIMDLDHFKEVNDTFGHHMGDRLLAEVGPRLHEELRDGDTLARIGGDEFAVVLPGAGEPVAVAVAERIITALEQPFLVGGQSLSVGASIGIACSPVHALDSDTLLQRADAAMYVAKGSRGTYAGYDQSMDDTGSDRLALAAELGEALATTGQLILHYQPLIDPSGTLVAVEALVRWDHPRRGLLAPGEFVPLAERSGFMRRLTEQVLRLAVGQARDWRAAGRAIAVSVNISTRDLRDPRFVELIREVLRENDLPASTLTLEVTESALMSDQKHVVETVARLREGGLAISVDDYGSGYASIGYLSRLAPDELKIDRAFVSAILTDRTAAAIVRTTIELGRALGIRVVAEGVEDRGTWLRFRELGVDRLQGYAIARPMPPEAIALWAEPESR